MSGRIHNLAVAEERGSRKLSVREATLKTDWGIVGDIHAGTERQISLLPFEAFDEVRGKLPNISPGDFAENITTAGLDYAPTSLGRQLRIGSDIILEITHIGKECHNGCYIKNAVGDCIMPRLGVFARVMQGGQVSVGDEIRWDVDNV